MRASMERKKLRGKDNVLLGIKCFSLWKMGEGNNLVSQTGFTFVVIWLKVASAKEQISIWSG